MNTNIKSWSLIATILIAPPLLVTLSKPATAQVVKSDRQAQEPGRTHLNFSSGQEKS